MKKQYLLGKAIQSIIFSVLVMFSVNKKTLTHFLLFFTAFFVVNMLIDYIYGRIIDKKLRKDLEKKES